MIPFGTETVTRIRRTEETGEDGRRHAVYDKLLLTGCSWRHMVRLVRSDGFQQPTETTVCRIPLENERPDIGDLLVLGNVEGAIGSASDYQSIIEAHRESGAFFVASVSDNSRSGVIPHYIARS